MVVLVSSEHLYMGNKMMLYGNLIASAQEHHFKMKNPSFAPYASNFEIPYQDNLCRFPIKKSSTKWSKKFRNWHYKLMYKWVMLLIKLNVNNKLIGVIDIDWEAKIDLNSAEFIDKVKNTKLLYLHGWLFRSPELVQKHSDIIRNYFKPRVQFSKNVEALFQKHNPNNAIVVGVHIRQGDFKTFENGRYYFETEQYVQFMQKMQDLLKGEKVKFMICSNVKQNDVLFNSFDWFYGTGHFIEDMYALAKCNYIMGPPSTYSTWASFYGRAPIRMLEQENVNLSLEDFQIRKWL